MLTKEQVRDAIKQRPEDLDFPSLQDALNGDWTERAIIEWLRKDVDYSFDKALARRANTAWLGNELIKMWLWVLEDDLQHHNEYLYYGLPLSKLVAIKYGFENRIGDDTGSEAKYKG